MFVLYIESDSANGVNSTIYAIPKYTQKLVKGESTLRPFLTLYKFHECTLTHILAKC